MLKERLEQLKAQKQTLQLQLEEISFLIHGYENTIAEQEKAEETQTEE